jgi:hypothetical protein
MNAKQANELKQAASDLRLWLRTLESVKVSKILLEVPRPLMHYQAPPTNWPAVNAVYAMERALESD